MLNAVPFYSVIYSVTVTSSTYSQLRAKLLYHSYNLKNPIRDDNFILSDSVFKICG